jgi:hypothetical protein
MAGQIISILPYLKNSAPRLDVGCTLESGSVRMHRFRDHIVLWDLTNAGKRGRKVSKVSARITSKITERDEALDMLAQVLAPTTSFEAAEQVITAYGGLVELERYEERGVDVQPAGFETIKISTVKLSLEAGYREFTIRCERDKHNLPTAIPREGATKSVPQFYRWVAANRDRVETMSFHELLTEMLKLNIKYHQYCAMD